LRHDSTTGRFAIAIRLVGWRLLLPIARRALKLERLVGLTANPRPRPRSVELEGFAVRVAGRLWRKSEAPCLERSLALHRQLGAAGAKPQLVLGIDKDHHGHAWVTLDGQALLEAEPPEDSYIVLVRYDPSGAPTR
jgi:hypothetical protein